MRLAGASSGIRGGLLGTRVLRAQGGAEPVQPRNHGSPDDVTPQSRRTNTAPFACENLRVRPRGKRRGRSALEKTLHALQYAGVDQHAVTGQIEHTPA